MPTLACFYALQKSLSTCMDYFVRHLPGEKIFLVEVVGVQYCVGL